MRVAVGEDAADRKAAAELRITIERSYKQYAELTGNIDRYLYSQFAIGACTPVTARTTAGTNNFSIQQYVQTVIDGNRAFPLDPRMQDLRFHTVLISSPRYQDVARVGEETLAAKGSLRIPFFSRDRLFWLVIDTRRGRIFTEQNARLRNPYSSPDLLPLEEFDLSFRDIKALHQRIVADHALYGIGRDSYALGFSPKGKAPNYTFENLIHCLYGEQVQRTISRNLADFVFQVVGNPSLETILVDPGKKSRDWIMTGAEELAVGAMVAAGAVVVVVAVHPGNSSDGNNQSHTQTTLNTAQYSAEVIQNSLNVLMAHAMELVRAADIQGGKEDNLSMFAMLRGSAFALIDPSMPKERMARVDNLITIASR
jgi:hypothetical protein